MATAIFESKHPHKTPWLKITSEDGVGMLPLLGELASAGWSAAKWKALAPAPHEYFVSCPGGGEGGEWTEEEYHENLRRAREVLERHGVSAPAKVARRTADERISTSK